MRLIGATPFSFNKVVIPDGGPNFMRGYGLGAKHVCDEIAAAPTIDALPVVHGRWKATKAGGSNYPFWDNRCSECGYTTSIVARKWNYCPVCGAKMDLEGTDADKT